MAISYTTASLCATFVCVLLLLTSLGIDIYSTIELQSPSAPVIEFGFQEVRSDDASVSSRYECDGPVDLLTTFDCELVRDSGAATFALIFLALILYIAVGALVHYRKLFAVWVSIAGSLFTFSGMISWLAFAHQNLKDTGDDLSRPGDFTEARVGPSSSIIIFVFAFSPFLSLLLYKLRERLILMQLSYSDSLDLNGEYSTEPLRLK